MKTLNEMVEYINKIRETPYVPMTPEFRKQLIDYCEEACPMLKGTDHEKVIDGVDQFLSKSVGEK